MTSPAPIIPFPPRPLPPPGVSCLSRTEAAKAAHRNHSEFFATQRDPRDPRDRSAINAGFAWREVIEVLALLDTVEAKAEKLLRDVRRGRGAALAISKHVALIHDVRNRLSRAKGQYSRPGQRDLISELVEPHALACIAKLRADLVAACEPGA